MTLAREAAEPLRLFRINAGSCNGCDVELTATACLSRFAVERQGFRLTEDPASADIVLITGPLTVRVKEAVLELYARIPEGKVTVAVGACPISGGVFRESYAVDGPVHRHLPVQVNVPGCPPRPHAIVEGIRAAAALWRLKHGLAANAVEVGTPIVPEEALPLEEMTPPLVPGIRGKLSYDAAACAACRMCEYVCAAGAITFIEDGNGVHFTLKHNACAFCGVCTHYCKTGALKQTDNWHTAHYREGKEGFEERGSIRFVPCAECGEAMLPVPAELIRRSFRALTRDICTLSTLCHECRLKRNITGALR